MSHACYRPWCRLVYLGTDAKLLASCAGQSQQTVEMKGWNNIFIVTQKNCLLHRMTNNYINIRAKTYCLEALLKLFCIEESLYSEEVVIGLHTPPWVAEQTDIQHG